MSKLSVTCLDNVRQFYDKLRQIMPLRSCDKFVIKNRHKTSRHFTTDLRQFTTFYDIFCPVTPSSPSLFGFRRFMRENFGLIFRSLLFCCKTDREGVRAMRVLTPPPQQKIACTNKFWRNDFRGRCDNSA